MKQGAEAQSGNARADAAAGRAAAGSGSPCASTQPMAAAGQRASISPGWLGLVGGEQPAGDADPLLEALTVAGGLDTAGNGMGILFTNEVPWEITETGPVDIASHCVPGTHLPSSWLY